MTMQPHTVILAGAGHVHLCVAAHAKALIERGARVVLIDPGEFIQDRVESVDTATRRLRLAGGRDLANDYLSLNAGGRVKVDILLGAEHDATVWPVKPISNLWKRDE